MNENADCRIPIAERRTPAASGPFGIRNSAIGNRLWVTDGTRTRDVQDHNLALCQLSYGHHRCLIFICPAATVNAPR
jgi:hypothetical protein